MIQNIKEKMKIEDLIKKYYKISKDDIDYFMVLPLKENKERFGALKREVKR